MQFTALILAALASVALATPTTGNADISARGTGINAGGGGSGGGAVAVYEACSGTYDTLECCGTDVLGLADLDCSVPTEVPTSAEDFQSICADLGKSARCCILPVLGLAVLCDTPIGVDS